MLVSYGATTNHFVGVVGSPAGLFGEQLLEASSSIGRRHVLNRAFVRAWNSKLLVRIGRLPHDLVYIPSIVGAVRVSGHLEGLTLVVIDRVSLR
jgi:hypothetical protein